MNATLSAPLPSEEINYRTGVFRRLVNAYRANPIQFNVGGTLFNIGRKHLAMLKGIAKVRSDIAALPATLGTAPAVFRLKTLSSSDATTRRIETEFAALTSETARADYIKSMVKCVTKPAPAAATPQAKAPAPMPVAHMKAAPKLTLDEQFAALTTPEAKAAFLKQHGSASLKRR